MHFQASKGHRRTASDAEFRELTLRDAKQSMNDELEKLIKTAKPEHQGVWFSVHYCFIFSIFFKWLLFSFK